MKALIVVPNAYVDAANALAASFAITQPTIPDFSVTICTLPDTVTITHRACCPELGPELEAALPGLQVNFPGSYYWTAETIGPTQTDSWLAGVGLARYFELP